MKLKFRLDLVLFALGFLILVVWIAFFLVNKFWVLTKPAETYYTGAAYLEEEHIKEFPLKDLEDFDKKYDFKILSIEGGSIQSIPPEIGQFVSLVDVKIINSALKEIPPEIGSLVNLETLDLTGNDLSSLPTEIGQLSKLEKLYLTGNPISPKEAEKIKELLPNTQIFF